MISIHVEIREIRPNLHITTTWPSNSSILDPEVKVLSVRFRTEVDSIGLRNDKRLLQRKVSAIKVARNLKQSATAPRSDGRILVDR